MAAAAFLHHLHHAFLVVLHSLRITMNVVVVVNSLLIDGGAEQPAERSKQSQLFLAKSLQQSLHVQSNIYSPLQQRVPPNIIPATLQRNPFCRSPPPRESRAKDVQTYIISKAVSFAFTISKNSPVCFDCDSSLPHSGGQLEYSISEKSLAFTIL